jgi:iron complex transport system substrate-binding protein
MRHQRFAGPTASTALPWVLVFSAWLTSAAAWAEGPQRIVVVGGALTEIVYALGAEHRVVGVDTTSSWPPAAEALPEVGYQRSLSAEGVLSLGPDLVLAGRSAGPVTVLEQIRGSGMRVHLLESEDSPEGLLAKIEAVGQVLALEPEAARLAQGLDTQMTALAARLATLNERPRVAFLLNVGRGAPLASGHDTAADAVIRLAGGVNALSGYRGYKPVNAEAMIAAAPDVLLTTERTLDLVGGAAGMLELPGIALTPAGRAQRIEAMDALYLLGFGPRTPQALDELARRLHPGIVEAAVSDVGR